MQPIGCFFNITMKKENRPPTDFNNALKYSGVGFQIVGTAIIGFFLGYKIDGWRHLQKPYFTALLAVVFTFLGLYIGLREFFQTPK